MRWHWRFRKLSLRMDSGELLSVALLRCNAGEDVLTLGNTLFSWAEEIWGISLSARGDADEMYSKKDDYQGIVLGQAEDD